ncbi:protoporphyrinogen/coproporphyrinogen oxidase [Paeniglutamicibacter cryotolerans]|uniref:Oxygen-dependent protoporphyrinogen oxidase n=1 Tax=Paeniglutamicibacter cryotolerans TaxID=670079 RepID=A0A839QL56_9MICC|nr:FAD-dependent oxidoreductase [Paeniglutamicibacter cryotolerans]MBB2996540.1 oxygen-dependent protoporphyrinogen oxidase [Paeniglutamicibacter cryotolerans]
MQQRPAGDQEPAARQERPATVEKSRVGAATSTAAAHALRLLHLPRTTPEAAPRGPAAIVIGGGISGLIAARELAITGHQVNLFEASAVFGGAVGMHEVAGLRLDAGAESFATRSTAVADLAAELGLGGDITYPRPGGAWLQLQRGGTDVALPLPATGILGIPGDPWADDVKAAIGRTGALRAAADLITPLSKKMLESPLSLGALVRARMGRAVLDHLVTPIVSGVHSADPDTLDLDAVAPGLRAKVLEHGSLAKAVAAMRAAAPAGSAVGGITGGMYRLAEALVADLKARDVGLHLNREVVALYRDGAADAPWRIELAARSAEPEAQREKPAKADRTVAVPAGALTGARLVVAIDGPGAVDLLGSLDAGFAAHRPARGTGVSLVTLVVDRPELDEAPRGTGVLVAPDVQGIGAKALTHATAKWEWLADDSGPGSHVLRLSYGRLSEVDAELADADDATLYENAVRDAARLLAVPLTGDDVVGWDVVRYIGALPFATTGHKARVAAFNELASGFGGLDVVGAWISGTGLAAVVADTRSRLRVGAA